MTIKKTPSWMDKIAPGAAHAARDISGWPQTKTQCERLKRLVAKDMEPAWRELDTWRGKKKPNTTEQQHDAQYAVFRAAYLAPDRLLKSEISSQKAKLANIGRQLTQAARDFNEVMADPQMAIRVANMWDLYRVTHGTDPLTKKMTEEDVRLIASMLERLGYFAGRTAAETKPEMPEDTRLIRTPADPEARLREPRSEKERQTAVVRYIAESCKSHYGSPMHDTTSKLARASLNEEISVDTVKGAVRQLRNRGASPASKKRLRHGSQR